MLTITESSKNSIATTPTTFITKTSHVNLNIIYTSNNAMMIAQLDKNNFTSAEASSLRNLTAIKAKANATIPPTIYQNIS